MTTLLITHAAGLNHATPQGHPERADRLRAIEEALAAEDFRTLVREDAPMAPLEVVALCHPIDFVEQIREIAPKEGLVQIDGDTVMSPGSFEATLRAVGGACRAVDALIAGEADNAFVAMRPPGHHAETTRPMGFCLFNHAAIAARHAQKAHGLDRVALVDFDVHHGNGSQEIFWSDPSVLYCSTHQMPLYPGTGALSERGDRDTIVNAPLRPGDGGNRFREAFESRILPRLAAFGPELIVISAGFDAHRRDPLASLEFEAEDFAWATAKLMEAASKSAGHRVVSVLEGGYDLKGLADSVTAHVTTLMKG